MIVFFLGGFFISSDNNVVKMSILIGWLMRIFWIRDIKIDVNYLLDIFVFYIKL